MTAIANTPTLPLAAGAPPAPPVPPPLSAVHLQEIAAARRAAKPVLRCATVAAFSGWTTGLFAIFTLLLSIGDWPAMLLGAGMCFTASFELRGSRLLKRLQPHGARVLGWNQVAFGAMLVSYAFWKMHTPPDVSSLISQPGSSGNPEVDEMLSGIQADLGPMVSNIMMLVYIIIAAVGVVVPGLTSVYYFTRKGRVEKLLRKTPEWVVDVMRAHG